MSKKGVSGFKEGSAMNGGSDTVLVKSYLCSGENPELGRSDARSLERFYNRNANLADVVMKYKENIRLTHVCPFRVWIRQGPAVPSYNRAGGRLLVRDFVETHGNWRLLRNTTGKKVQEFVFDNFTSVVGVTIETTNESNPEASDWPCYNQLQAWKENVIPGDMMDVQDRRDHSVYHEAVLKSIDSSNVLQLQLSKSKYWEKFFPHQLHFRLEPLHAFSVPTPASAIDRERDTFSLGTLKSGATSDDSSSLGSGSGGGGGGIAIAAPPSSASLSSSSSSEITIHIHHCNKVNPEVKPSSKPLSMKGSSDWTWGQFVDVSWSNMKRKGEDQDPSRLRYWIYIDPVKIPHPEPIPLSNGARIMSAEACDCHNNWKFLRSINRSFKLQDFPSFQTTSSPALKLIFEWANYNQDSALPTAWPRFPQLEGWKSSLWMGDLVDLKLENNQYMIARVARINPSGNLFLVPNVGSSWLIVKADEVHARIFPALSYSSAADFDPDRFLGPADEEDNGDKDDNGDEEDEEDDSEYEDTEDEDDDEEDEEEGEDDDALVPMTSTARNPAQHPSVPISSASSSGSNTNTNTNNRNTTNTNNANTNTNAVNNSNNNTRHQAAAPPAAKPAVQSSASAAAAGPVAKGVVNIHFVFAGHPDPCQDRDHFLQLKAPLDLTWGKLQTVLRERKDFLRNTSIRFWLQTDEPPMLEDVDATSRGEGRQLKEEVVYIHEDYRYLGAVRNEGLLSEVNAFEQHLILEYATGSNPRPQDWPRYPYLDAWRESLRVNDHIDVKDGYQFHAAVVTTVKKNTKSVLVSFLKNKDRSVVHEIAQADLQTRIMPLYSQSRAAVPAPQPPPAAAAVAAPPTKIAAQQAKPQAQAAPAANANTHQAPPQQPGAAGGYTIADGLAASLPNAAINPHDRFAGLGPAPAVGKSAAAANKPVAAPPAAAPAPAAAAAALPVAPVVPPELFPVVPPVAASKPPPAVAQPAAVVASQAKVPAQVPQARTVAVSLQQPAVVAAVAAKPVQPKEATASASTSTTATTSTTSAPFIFGSSSTTSTNTTAPAASSQPPPPLLNQFVSSFNGSLSPPPVNTAGGSTSNELRAAQERIGSLTMDLHRVEANNREEAEKAQQEAKKAKDQLQKATHKHERANELLKKAERDNAQLQEQIREKDRERDDLLRQLRQAQEQQSSAAYELGRYKGDQHALGGLSRVEEARELRRQLYVSLQAVEARETVLLKLKEDEKKCVICTDKDKTVALQPCGHLCLCADCGMNSMQVSKCPMCRMVITGRTNIYM